MATAVNAGVDCTREWILQAIRGRRPHFNPKLLTNDTSWYLNIKKNVEAGNKYALVEREFPGLQVHLVRMYSRKKQAAARTGDHVQR